MPVRFQVDPDFYDHHKVLGMSDAAFALWVRAGSYSAAKLLDGFVPDDALSLFSRTQQEAAGELVRRGLWRRKRGGYIFHEWEQRNLLKTRVEADREQWREQKRRQRGSAKEPQANGQFVQGGHQGGHQPDSGESPDMSVSVSVSESMSSPPSPPAAGSNEVPHKESRRKRRATPIPNDWKPTDDHRRRALEAELDLGREVAKFKAHADANDRRQVNWNGAFTQWLLHAEEYQRPRGTKPNAPTGWWDN